MEFFIPACDTDEQRNRMWKSIKDFAESSIGWDVTDRKIYSIDFTHNGKEYSETVDKNNKQLGGITMAILETSSCYLVCTPNRGVLRGEPGLVGKGDTINVIDFDE